MAQWETELTELVTRRSGALVGYAYSLTRDKPQAEDLVQDALVKVYSRLRRPSSAEGQTQLDLDRPEASNAEGYVRRAILTIYLDGYRRRNHWAGLKHLLADDASAPGADRVATARVDVGSALKQLSPRQREAVMLRFFDDLTVPQIAAALGTTQGTIKRHLFDAMAVLRQVLAEATVPAMDTDLDERLGTVTGAVRRRRTAKVGAAAGVSMVLAGLLAIAVWGPARILSEPVPPATPSPATAAVGAARVPDAWRSQGAQYRCGMDVTDLVSSSDVVHLELTGDVEPADIGSADGGLTAPVRITRTDVEGPTLDGGRPRLVFARDGRVVDLGRGWNEQRDRLPDAGQSADGVAEATAVTTCGAWTTYSGVRGEWEKYLDPRPAGTYDVYAVLPWHDSSGASGLAVSEPVAMDVPAVEVSPEEPLTVGIRDGYQPPWLEGTDLACGSRASDIPGGPDLASERSGLSLTAEATARVGDLADTLTVTFTETEGEAVDTTRAPVTLVWLSKGRVVGLVDDLPSAPVEDLRLEANGTTSDERSLEPDLTCLLDPDAGMPRGNHENYSLYVLTELEPGSGGERRFISAGVRARVVIWG